MAINSPYISSTQVASSVPFDNVIAPTFTSTDVQSAIKEIRDQEVQNNRTQATTAAGTLTLLSTDLTTQFLTGSAVGYNVILPNATLIPTGIVYTIYNTSSETVQIKDGNNNNLFVLAQSSIGVMILRVGGSAAGTWIYEQTIINTSTGIINYNLTSSTTFTTTSTTDVLITGFTLTPQAGTYAVLYNAESLLTTTPKTHWWSVYKNGIKITDSERSQDTAHSNQNMNDSTMSIFQATGSEQVDVRVRTQNGSLSIYERSLLLIRLGT